MNQIYKLDNIFSDEHIKILNNIISDSINENFVLDFNLGRLQITIPELPPDIVKHINKKVKSLFNINKIILSSVQYVQYSGEYGSPNLPPHFDGDMIDVIMDFQLSSNTQWALGIDLDVYEIQDNSAIIFNPNTNIHWRPIKKFKDKEYVKMIFFRFFDSENRSDYSYARYSQDDEIFKKVLDVRNSLSNFIE